MFSAAVLAGGVDDAREWPTPVKVLPLLEQEMQWWPDLPRPSLRDEGAAGEPSEQGARRRASVKSMEACQLRFRRSANR